MYLSNKHGLITNIQLIFLTVRTLSPVESSKHGQKPRMCFISNKETILTLRPGSGMTLRVHFFALLAGIGIEFKFSSS